MMIVAKMMISLLLTAVAPTVRFLLFAFASIAVLVLNMEVRLTFLQQWRIN